MKALLCSVVLGIALAFTHATAAAAQSAPGTCSAESFARFEKALAAAQAAFQNGNPEPLKALWSHADDVTLMGAYGGHERGWALVGARLSRIGGMKTTSTHDNDEVVSRIVGSNVAMIVQQEHIVNPGAPTDNLRVTHIARCEGSAWRVVHRHADPLMETRIPSFSAVEASVATPTAMPSPAQADVRNSVQAFYDAYNAHEFEKLAQFTTEDWTHITPGGIVRRGRAEVLVALKQVHATFLKGVTDTPEEIGVRFATPDVAIVTVRSRTTPFTSPDGVRHENEGRIRTFVVVKHDDRWLISQDQNTTIPTAAAPRR